MADTVIEADQQTHQANATGTHFGTHQVDRDNQAMQEGQPRSTVKKGDDSRVLVETLLIGPPGLQGASGHRKRLGRLTQGESLGLQSKILIEEVSSLGSTPAWVMLSIASLRVLDDGSHSDLLFHPSPVYRKMAQDGEVANFFQPLPVSSR